MEKLCPTIRYERKYEASIDEYVEDVKKIWPLNSKRSPLHIWMEVVGSAASVCEGVRQNKWDTVVDELAKLTMWWFAFVGRVNDLDVNSGDLVIFRMPKSPSDILWSNYPLACPVCLSYLVLENKNADEQMILDQLPSHCECLIRKSEVENRSEETKKIASKITKRIAQIKIDEKPKSLSNFENSFLRIYQMNINVLSAEEIAFHLLEEVGEVSKALVEATIHREIIYPDMKLEANIEEFIAEVKEKSEHIEKELADVFSWIISLLGKSRQILASSTRLCMRFNKEEASKDFLESFLRTLGLSSERINIVDIIWNKYKVGDYLGHKTCKLNVCECNKAGQLLLQDQNLPKEIIARIV
ncbi:MAG: hypothetical protein ACOWWR_15480 [Eubacteriales bacterium]